MIDAYKKNQRKVYASAKLSYGESSDLLLELTRAYPQTILILDAFDKSFEESRGDFIETIDHLILNCSRLKVLISSRRDDNIKRQLKTVSNLSIEATDNGDDISKFVREKIEYVQRRRRVPISKGLESEIVETILQKSQGM